MRAERPEEGQGDVCEVDDRRHGRDWSRLHTAREMAAQAEGETSHELVKRDANDARPLKVSADRRWRDGEAREQKDGGSAHMRW